MFIQIVPVDVSIFRIQSARTKEAALEIRKDLVRDYLKYKRGTRRLGAVRRPNQASFPGVVPLDRRLRSHTRLSVPLFSTTNDLWRAHGRRDTFKFCSGATSFYRFVSFVPASVTFPSISVSNKCVKSKTKQKLIRN